MIRIPLVKEGRGRLSGSIGADFFLDHLASVVHLPHQRFSQESILLVGLIVIVTRRQDIVYGVLAPKNITVSLSCRPSESE